MTGPTPQRPQSLRHLPIAVVVCALLGVALLVTIVLVSVLDSDDPARAATPTSPATGTSSSAPQDDVDRLNRVSVERGVGKVLRDSYGISDVGEVSCPKAMIVTVGAEYTCTTTVGGEPKSVTVRVTRADGTYEVGRPR
ncbi:DUF4333 domain-containing protein [Nocardia sp. NPDC003693]